MGKKDKLERYSEILMGTAGFFGFVWLLSFLIGAAAKDIIFILKGIKNPELSNISIIRNFSLGLAIFISLIGNILYWK